MNPFRLLRDQEPDPPQYYFTLPALEDSIRPPPCPCSDCQDGFYPENAQKNPEHSYHQRLSNAQAESRARSFVDDIQKRRSRLSEKVQVFGDILITRWKKQSQAKRATLLKEAAPDLEAQQWLLPRYNYMREKYYILDRKAERRRQLLLPWLNVHVLKTNPAVLFALLHYRTAYPPQSWATFDSNQLKVSWAAGYFDVDFSAKCVVMHGDRFGSLVDWEAKAAHRGDILGYPRAILILEAQASLLKALCNIVDKILEGVDPLQTPRAEKWHDLVNHEAFRETGAIEFWSPYTNQAFSRPPMFNCDYLVTLAKSRLEETGDHLWYLQCDSDYMRRHVKIWFAPEAIKKAPEQQRAMMLTQRIVLEIESHLWWRWIEMECNNVEAVCRRFSDSSERAMQLRALSTAVEKFLGSIRAYVREDLTKSDTAFSSEEAGDLLGVVSAHLSREYIQDKRRAEAEILTAIKIADKATPTDGAFNAGSEPSLTSTTIAQGREKVKTRGEQGSSGNDVTEPQAEDAGEVTKGTVITLPEEALGVIHLMFPSKDGAAKDVTWNRFVNMMTKAGFTARNNTGSAVSFKQVSGSGAGGSIVFHKPHPADKIDPILLRIMGKRMTKWFGWKRELFALQGEATSVVQG
ncbi:unnamed protein product [Fusarium fujikuroi]|uniref:Uncharacterized protein n=1 Tax=Fusarium fujikuroi TaxID=5127 RepID=A0A9Q9UAG3_FUSFU|nr:uncharacterized protein Y057_10372 [Fusarium fujikuroi]SCV60277.1 uncharacterized protein FFFS_14846 [Fusarium fujikuroi]VTT60729.1 unnamed protein product [Fusarium fujikuroi]VTT69616.1 unnamed protein product [Fusarium fujikuroi]